MVECLRCGEEFSPITEADIMEGLCWRCIYDPERTQSYLHKNIRKN